VRALKHPAVEWIADARPARSTSRIARSRSAMNNRWQVSFPSSGTERVARFSSIQAGSIRNDAGSSGSRAAANSPNVCFSTMGGFTPLATRM
jgi:hypothetical protein